MARIRNFSRRPRRTRGHIIADLSVLHFQWIACNCGYVTEIPIHDYGYDLNLITFTDGGEPESGAVYLQLKATDHFDETLHKDGKSFSFSLERWHLNLWREESMPVIAVIYDAKRERAYWLYVQSHLREIGFDWGRTQEVVTLRFPMNHALDMSAMRQFREFKAAALNRLWEAEINDGQDNLWTVE